MNPLSAMPVKAITRLIGEHDTRPGHVIHHYIEQARTRTNLAEVTRVAIKPEVEGRPAVLACGRPAGARFGAPAPRKGTRRRAGADLCNRMRALFARKDAASFGGHNGYLYRPRLSQPR